MENFSHGAIREIPTDSKSVYAFSINGYVDNDASEALAQYMNDVFDKTEAVNLLIDLTGLTGSEWDNILDGDVIGSRARSLTNVNRYAVVGASEKAVKLIRFMDYIIPLNAQSFDPTESGSAWSFVGARPKPN